MHSVLAAQIYKHSEFHVQKDRCCYGGMHRIFQPGSAGVRDDSGGVKSKGRKKREGAEF